MEKINNFFFLKLVNRLLKNGKKYKIIKYLLLVRFYIKFLNTFILNNKKLYDTQTFQNNLNFILPKKGLIVTKKKKVKNLVFYDIFTYKSKVNIFIKWFYLILFKLKIRKLVFRILYLLYMIIFYPTKFLEYTRTNII